MSRRKWNWTEHQSEKLSFVLSILKDLHKYKPLTLRQIYYQLVSKEIIENKVSEYTMLSQLIKQARIDGYIDWNDVEDRVRSVHSFDGWDSLDDFLNYEINNFLKGYRRHRILGQPVYLEVWIEKDALSRLFSSVTKQYCIKTVICRGFSSASFIHDFTERVESAKQQDKKPIMLYFGDFDPSGNAMLNAMKETIESEMNCPGVSFKRIALQPEQISLYQLPHSPEAIKNKDSRTKKHVAEYGDLAVELDALPSNILVGMITEAIESELDMELFIHQKNEEERDLFDLTNTKDRIINLIEQGY